MTFWSEPLYCIIACRPIELSGLRQRSWALFGTQAARRADIRERTASLCRVLECWFFFQFVAFETEIWQNFRPMIWKCLKMCEMVEWKKKLKWWSYGTEKEVQKWGRNLRTAYTRPVLYFQVSTPCPPSELNKAVSAFALAMGMDWSFFNHVATCN